MQNFAFARDIKVSIEAGNVHMMSKKDNTHISKLLSYALRHRPDALGIVLDDNGWTDVQILLEQINAEGESLNMEGLKYIVDTSDKKRFGFNEDFTKIRANQGHSVEVHLDYPTRRPPDLLYHGTVERFTGFIMKDGLQKMNRHHVHLSKDTDTAYRVGQRRGQPVILVIKAGEMFNAGYTFYISENNVWLTDNVPPRFIEPLLK